MDCPLPSETPTRVLLAAHLTPPPLSLLSVSHQLTGLLTLLKSVRLFTPCCPEVLKSLPHALDGSLASVPARLHAPQTDHVWCTSVPVSCLRPSLVSLFSLVCSPLSLVCYTRLRTTQSRCLGPVFLSIQLYMPSDSVLKFLYPSDSFQHSDSPPHTLFPSHLMICFYISFLLSKFWIIFCISVWSYSALPPTFTSQAILSPSEMLTFPYPTSKNSCDEIRPIQVTQHNLPHQDP